METKFPTDQEIKDKVNKLSEENKKEFIRCYIELMTNPTSFTTCKEVYETILFIYKNAPNRIEIRTEKDGFLFKELRDLTNYKEMKNGETFDLQPSFRWK